MSLPIEIPHEIPSIRHGIMDRKGEKVPENPLEVDQALAQNSKCGISKFRIQIMKGGSKKCKKT